MRLSHLLLPALTLANAHARDVVIQDGQWTNTTSGEKIVLTGTNVVMKGDPWLPAVEGSAICDSTENTGSSTSCQTFNEADVNHIKSLGYNMIRLGERRV